jgi:hypothetical protein
MGETAAMPNSSGSCERSSKPRQAVVLIHGIGEQRPMETLKGFVAALLCDHPYYSKPDVVSDSYELRRFKLRRDALEGWPETDFYEYYWAHQMYGTTWSHVLHWFLRVMKRGGRFLGAKPTPYPRLRFFARISWGVAVAAAAGAIWLVWMYGWNSWTTILAAGGTVAVLGVLYLLSKLFFLQALLDVVGDAARYLDVAPKNVARRYDILRGGIGLLQKLHEEHDENERGIKYRYGRVVLVGHSLGSVIAYDILRHYWGNVNGLINVKDLDLSKVENFAGSNGPPAAPKPDWYTDSSDFHQAQRRAWKAMNIDRPHGVVLPKSALRARWLVSDLITLGSPLAHAPVLLADGLRDLDTKRMLRELPTCPPDRSQNLNPGHFVVDLSAEAERIEDYPILHHAACFAVTRWTNFWFPIDPIGGPLPAAFGTGIEDVPLANVSINPAKSHVSYWQRSDKCVAKVRQILVSADEV